MRIIYGFCLLLLLCSVNGLAQGTNPCGVIARLSPGNDTVVTMSTIIQFKNESVNYTDFRFILYGTQYPMNYAFGRMNFAVGLHEIKLVAYNGSCTDTAVVYVFQPGPQPVDRTNIQAYYGLTNFNQNATDIDAAPAGGYIMSGHVNDNNYTFRNYPNKGLLIRTQESGCIEWSRVYETGDPSFSKIYSVKATADGGFAAIGDEKNGATSLFKVDANGDMLWSKVYTADNGALFFANGLQITDDGGYILSGSCGPALMIMRLDASGNVVWSRQLKIGNTNGSGVNRIAQEGNELFVGGYIHYYIGPNHNFGSILIKLNYTTGAVEWTKKYKTSYSEISLFDLRILPGQEVLVNTNAGGNVGGKPLNTFFTTDLDGTVKSARTLFSNVTMSIPGQTRMIPLANGQFYVTMTGTELLNLQPGFTTHSLVLKLGSDFSVQWSKEYGGAGRGFFIHPTVGPFESFVSIGDENGYGIPAYSGSRKIMFRRIDSSGGAAVRCNNYDNPATTQPATILSDPFIWDSNSTVNMIAGSSRSRIAEAYTQVRYGCPEFVDSCSFVKLTGPGSVCNLNSTYTYKLHKNKACNQPVQWTTRGAVQIVQQTDSSLTVRFGSFGGHTIVALLPYSCSPVLDSLVVEAASKTPPLSLGPDTSICVNNSRSLKAGPRFLNYEWQDGSTDSVLTITAPGQYWVKVTDSCDNISRDTVTITRAAPIPFNAGADRTKCNNDTIHLLAPPGFLNYSWTPAYNINASNKQQVIANPTRDTAYFVQAEKTPGCFAYDTIRVKVNSSPPIQLGQDVSFCQGDSIALNAGNGFASYQWSNGNSSPKISVKTAGTFSVIGTTIEGCKSYDTLRVLRVFANPTVQLDASPFLCIGATRTLDAGSFASYLWSDGSINRTLRINATGVYAVTVTDNNQCKGSDTSTITGLRALPHDFLPTDTMICIYGKLQLRPLADFKSYTWSTNELSPSIIISKAGRYSLQVTDQYGCVGKDTILVNAKDCLYGFYIPNVFTPNADGKNDIFKPMIFGRIIKYNFAIYNRWGQKVFETNDINKGWTGNYTGSQSTNQYVWSCTYQLESEAVKSEKGTVILMR